jgi:hypothetical protein
MAEADPGQTVERRWRRLAIPVLVLGLIAAPAIVSPAERAAAAECPADYCLELKTNANGIYVLTIPAEGIALMPGGSALADCIWQVEAQFSDGSEPETYVFDATKEFKSSHKFPEPGVYYVDIYATEGVHGDGPSECPDRHIQAKVTYPEPPPPKEEPEPEEPGAQLPPGSPASPASPLSSSTAPSSAGSHEAPYWRACGTGVRAHRVTCRKARQVIREARDFLARARLKQGASFKAAGFNCRLRRGSLSCRRGPQSVLAPTAA